VRVAPLVLGVVALLGACDGSGPPAPPLDPSTIDPSSASESCVAVEMNGATAQRFEADGSCVPGDVLVLYRCAPTAVPVLRISSVSGPALFLGGPFAVPVSSLPAQVRFAGAAGAAGGTEVLIADPLPTPTPTPVGSSSLAASPSVEGDPVVEPERLVYVREDGSTERWLRLEGRRTLHDPPIVWIIGDSIMDGGREEVEAALADWSLTLYAEPGRSSSSGVELAQAAVEQDADVVVIELGTNDASSEVFRAHLVETLDTVADVPLVIWQTAKGSEDDLSIQEVNEAIREVAPTYPNVSIADWTAFVPDEALQTDGIHPDEGFQHLEAELLVPILTQWRNALDRSGATTCGRDILRETS
jgi:hypothetical protein